MLKQIGYYLSVGLVGLAIGYYLMPKKEVVKTVEKQVDRVVTIVKTIKPDGTITEEKVITDKSKISSETNTKINANRPKYSLNILGGTDMNRPLIGLHANKEFLGPITLGAFGLTSTTVDKVILGLSIGLNF